MKHGIKQRKLSRSTGHRRALLRNLVSALLHHEQITTTVAKAAEAQKVAEKIITLGKKGTETSWRSAQGYLLPPHYNGEPFHTKNNKLLSGSKLERPRPESETDPDSPYYKPPRTLLPKLFTTLADRYADRAGGFTRLVKFGRRPGDNAPKAILSLVDGQRDLNFEMAARIVGREVGMVKTGKDIQTAVEQLVRAPTVAGGVGLSAIAQSKLRKTLAVQGEVQKLAFVRKAVEHAVRLAVIPQVDKAYEHDYFNKERPSFRQLGTMVATFGPKAGVLDPETAHLHGGLDTPLGIARGALGRRDRRKAKKEDARLAPL